MAQFKYEALNKLGNTVQGTMVANDDNLVAAHLAEIGLNVLGIEEIAEKKTKSKKSGKKVTVADLALFSRQLSAMLGAGIPVTQAITTLSKQTENMKLTLALEDIASLITGGANLSDAFDKHSDVFPALYRAMIGAGELGGILDISLSRLSVQLQKEKQLNDNINAATSYPKMIGGFAVLMFFGMLIVLVPIFEGFIPANATIPAITALTFSLSHSLRTYWYIWISALGGITFMIIRFVKSKAGRTLWENNKMKIPLFGNIIQKSVIARFSRTLATLLQGGIPVVQALESAGPTSGSDLIADAVEKSVEKIKSGKNISEPLSECGLFPPMVINMIAIGEEAGTLTDLLDKIAEFYEDDVATATKTLGAVIEPIMLIVIGVVVGAMLISLYMPIFTAVVA
ncbi:MAG: type II secretion system F family protein [Oscillospiraceae bacterium]